MTAAATVSASVDGDLLGRCRAGDDGAWRQLYEENFGFVYRVARRLGTPTDEIDDVVQEVFIVVHQNLGRFDGGRLTTWMYRICANVATDRHRRRRVRRAFQRLKVWIGSVMDDSPESHACRTSAERSVEQVFERMSPRKREVLAMFELEHLGVEEIAERLGCSPGTVKSRLHHARKEFVSIAGRMGCLDVEGTHEEGRIRG